MQHFVGYIVQQLRDWQYIRWVMWGLTVADLGEQFIEGWWSEITDEQVKYQLAENIFNPYSRLNLCQKKICLRIIKFVYQDNVPIQSSPLSHQYEQSPSSSQFEQDQVIEVNAGSFSCPSCPQSFSNMSALILHSK